jgi:uncharacterized membrane protein (UPF0127 family)
MKTLFALAFILVTAACGSSSEAKQQTQKPQTTQTTEAEGPVFQKKTIRVGKIAVEVEIADNDELREHGLMFRKQMPDNHGMLFTFEDERTLNFWMKNTLIPLSIAYIDKSHTIVDIQEMTPASDLELQPRTYPSAKPAQYALEMNKGWFKKNKVTVGQTVRLN